MNSWRRWGATALLVGVLTGCDDPVGPAHEIAGEYELAATLRDDVRTPLGPTDKGALLVLNTDRTWVLIRHGAGRAPTADGFGLTDRYRFVGTRGLALSMFTEAAQLQPFTVTATVDADTLTWGQEIFVRR